MHSLAIDIGSNSILAIVAKVIDGKLKIIEDKVYVTGLGRGIQNTNQFNEVSMAESLNALKEIAALAIQYKIKNTSILATATEASRRASNANIYFDMVKKLTGIDVKIIKPNAEAYFASLGLCLSPGLTTTPCLLLDIGGASSEITLLKNRPFEIIKSVSLAIGSVVESEQVGLIEVVLNQTDLSEFTKLNDACDLWAISGSAISLAQVALQIKTVSELEGKQVTINQLNEMKKTLNNMDSRSLNDRFGKRASSIKGGLSVLISILKKLGKNELKISNFGLRHGLLYLGEIREEFLWKQ